MGREGPTFTYCLKKLDRSHPAETNHVTSGITTSALANRQNDVLEELETPTFLYTTSCNPAWSPNL